MACLLELSQVFWWQAHAHVRGSCSPLGWLRSLCPSAPTVTVTDLWDRVVGKIYLTAGVY